MNICTKTWIHLSYRWRDISEDNDFFFWSAMRIWSGWPKSEEFASRGACTSMLTSCVSIKVVKQQTYIDIRGWMLPVLCNMLRDVVLIHWVQRLLQICFKFCQSKEGQLGLLAKVQTCQIIGMWYDSSKHLWTGELVFSWNSPKSKNTEDLAARQSLPSLDKCVLMRVYVRVDADLCCKVLH